MLQTSTSFLHSLPKVCAPLIGEGLFKTLASHLSLCGHVYGHDEFNTDQPCSFMDTPSDLLIYTADSFSTGHSTPQAAYMSYQPESRRQKQRRYDERKRIAKEAHSHTVHSRTPGASRKTVFGPDPALSNYYAALDSVSCDVEVREDAPESHYYCVDPGYSGPMLYQWADGSVRLNSDPRAQVAQPREHLLVSTQVCSAFTIGKAAKLVCDVVPVCERVVISSYRALSEDDFTPVVVNPQEFDVCNPILRVLRGKFRNCRYDANSIKAIRHFTADYGFPRSSLVDTTLEYYLACLRRTHELSFQHVHNMRRTNNGQYVIEATEQVVALSPYTVKQEYHAPLLVEAEECDLPLDWPLRTDFTIDRAPIEELEGLFFNGREKGAQHSTVFYDIRAGDGKTFHEYRVSNNNLLHGSKRLIGAREDEARLRANAIRYGKMMYSRAWVARPDICPMLQTMINKRCSSGADSPFSVAQFVCNTMFDFVNRVVQPSVLHQVSATLEEWKYSSLCTALSWLGHPSQSRFQAAAIKHVKKALRSHYVNRSLVHTSEDIMVRSLSACVKRELAKPGKAPRLFVGYEAGCMYANELPEYVKVCLDGAHHFVISGEKRSIDLCVYIMAKPKSGDLETIFSELHEAVYGDNYVYAAIYSDDMVIAGVVDGADFTHNVDISSNDSSQDMPAFGALFLALSNFNLDLAEGLMRQCMLPIKIGDKILQFSGPFEGSGTVLTTCLNHLGSLTIILASVRLLADGHGISGVFTAGAAIVGHCVTVDDCGSGMGRVFEKVQFLKRSPYHREGNWGSYLNLGCVLRSFGHVFDDLQAYQLGVSPAQFQAMTHDERADRFFGSVIAGHCHEPSNPLIDALRDRFPNVGNISPAEALDWKPSVSEEGFNNTAGMCKRYDLNPHQLEELAGQIRSLKVGDVLSSTVAGAIYKQDYSLM